MAGSLDTILEALRSSGQSFSRAGQSFGDARQMSADEQKVKDKKEADKALETRIGTGTTLRDDMMKEIETNPDFDMTSFTTKAKPLVDEFVRMGKPELADALLKDPRALVEARDKAKREKEAAGVKATKDAGKESDEESDRRFTRATTLRKERDEVSKSTNKMVDAYTSLDDLEGIATDEKLSAPQRVAAQTSMLYGFIKTLDDAGAVREGDVDMVTSIKSIPHKLRLAAQHLSTGEPLLPEQIVGMREAAESLIRSKMKRQVKVDEQYEGLATSGGVNPKDVITNPAKDFLKDLDAKTAARAKKKKDAEEKPLGTESDAPPLKIIDTDAADIIRAKPETQQNFGIFLERLNQIRAEKKLPAMSPTEAEPLVWKALGYQVVPVKK